MAQATEIVIHAGWLLADPETAPKTQQSILIRDGKVAELASGFVEPPAGARVIDLKDRFVLPGLIDCHVHLTGQLGPGQRLGFVEDSDPKVGLDAAHRARLTLHAGFTTVRDLGARKPEVIYALREAVAEGKVPGPRILCVGAILSPTGGHGQTYGFRHDVCACVQAGIGVCDGVDGCRRAVRLQVAHGADAIKFVATGGVLSNLRAGIDQQFTSDEIKTIIETGHQLGRRVSAHAHGLAGINAALTAGVDSIEHGSFLDDSSIALFLNTGAFHVPTLIAGMTVFAMAKSGTVLTPAQSEKALIVGERIKAALNRSYTAGIPIAFGTDMGVGPHGQNAREFALMVESGMTAAHAIKAATLTAAKLLDIADDVGAIAPGKSADIIAVDADPLTDITELERVKFVMARGRAITLDRG
ncbi:MAG TPA: amidohydrolase family protein [Caulobacteraceae bacterium]|jgi:imidazolonepropionase-like amidohydrolase|nr:amidohydrolase family protein [Caulobacteraceae bacterium]